MPYERGLSMSKFNHLTKAALEGLLAAIVLTFFLKLVEYLSDYKVYTLLLNVDYIPFVNQFNFPEIVEVSFHLIVSIVLSVCLSIFIAYLKIELPNKVLLFYTGISFLIGLLLFPTTALSSRTPPITSIPSLTYWLAGHVLFGLILAILYIKREKFASKP